MSLDKVKNRSQMATRPHNVTKGRGPARLPFPGSSSCGELEAPASLADCLHPWSIPTLVKPRPRRADAHQMPQSLRSQSGTEALTDYHSPISELKGPRGANLWPLESRGQQNWIQPWREEARKTESKLPLPPAQPPTSLGFAAISKAGGGQECALGKSKSCSHGQLGSCFAYSGVWQATVVFLVWLGHEPSATNLLLNGTL